ncbi:MAG: ABC transporter ATP-binding protein [Lachnospiraceae bacterium]|nr:ABC transporter ATP-binding protein [Lachnospiraceae bacterium]
MRETLISFENYTFQYRSQAEPTIHDINLQIHKGERVIIVGPSGCGKSTLAHCLNGLNPFSYPGKSTGTLTICGVEAAQASIFELSRYVGTVLQDTDGQFIGMTVLEDIAFSMENDCVAQDEMKRRTKEEAAKVGLLDKLPAAPHELSGGQKQRVSMAGVLVNRVPILLFDEPLANLDPAAGREAMELIDDLQKVNGSTVVIIEHRLEDAMHRNADRIILMEEGRIVSDTTPTALFLSDRLSLAGIREPLYITALKYAGVKLTEEIHPERMEDMVLSDAAKAQVCKWFENQAGPMEKAVPEQMLSVEELSFGYTEEKENLSEISFTVSQGEMVSIVGKNGAGKSTLAKLLCGFVTQKNGSITLKGRDLSEDTIKERAGYIGYVMQNPNQMISKPMIYDEVAMSLRLKGMSEEEVEKRVFETLKICGLYPFRSWPVSALSYGQKKRVTIASILVQEPEMLILDEPTAGQDFRHYTEIMEFLKELNESGITVLMITHDMHLMLEYTERSLVFADGRMIADTTPARLFSDPELLKRASLKVTSLYELALRCGLDPEAYIEKFIQYDRQVRNE